MTEPIPNGPCLTQRLQGPVPARWPCFLPPVKPIRGANEERGLGHCWLLFPKRQSSRSRFWHLKHMTAGESSRHRVFCGLLLGGSSRVSLRPWQRSTGGCISGRGILMGMVRKWTATRTNLKALGRLSLARGSGFVLRPGLDPSDFSEAGLKCGFQVGLPCFFFQLPRRCPPWRSLGRLSLWLCLLPSLRWRDFLSLEDNWKMQWFCWCFGSFSTCGRLLRHRGLGAPGKPPISVCLQVPL